MAKDAFHIFYPFISTPPCIFSSTPLCTSQPRKIFPSSCSKPLSSTLFPFTITSSFPILSSLFFVLSFQSGVYNLSLDRALKVGVVSLEIYLNMYRLVHICLARQGIPESLGWEELRELEHWGLRKQANKQVKYYRLIDGINCIPQR